MKRMRVEINRLWQDENQTSGICTIFEGKFPIFSALSLERGWRNNSQNVSCIPAGEYVIKYLPSPRFRRHLWRVINVPSRSGILFHLANYWYELEGCISLGLKYKYLNKDNYRDVTNSADTMRVFESILKNEKEVRLIINNKL